MEKLIVICLLVIIILLLEDKFKIKITRNKRVPASSPEEKAPMIMGQPRPNERLSRTNTANESHIPDTGVAAGNFEQEIGRRTFDQQIPQEELDEVFGKGPDLWQEEEEWSRYGMSDDGDGFATGVTFEELGALGMVLRQEVTTPSLKEQAAATVQKIQGTELFSLLEQSMEGASRKIAALLDKSLSSSTDPGSSILRNNGKQEFDIGNFI